MFSFANDLGVHHVVLPAKHGVPRASGATVPKVQRPQRTTDSRFLCDVPLLPLGNDVVRAVLINAPRPRLHLVLAFADVDVDDVRSFRHGALFYRA